MTSHLFLLVCFLTWDGLVSGLAQNSRRVFFKQTAGGALGFSLSNLLNSNEAIAYPRRDVGSDSARSAETAAMNEQAYLTNNRLEASGFRLDTPEEEAEKLSNALSSFSYDNTKKSSKKSGRRTSSTNVSPSKPLRSKE